MKLLQKNNPDIFARVDSKKNIAIYNFTDNETAKTNPNWLNCEPS